MVLPGPARRCMPNGMSNCCSQAREQGAASRRDLDALLSKYHARMVSSCAGYQHAVLPRDTERCTNVVEFYYPEDIALFEREFIEAEQAAYHETAVEDDEICKTDDCWAPRSV